MLGISTFCLIDEPLPLALERLSGITDTIEVMDEGLHYLESSEPLQSFSRTYFIHSPCRGTNIASLLEPIRRASVEVMLQCFAIAADVDAGVVIHPGYFAWPAEREQAGRQLQKSVQDLAAAAREYSVEFYIENMGNWEYFFLKTPDELPLIDGSGFVLDVGHAHQNHCLDAFLSARPAEHYHLHDNDTSGDSHWAIGKGTIDFAPVIEAIRKNGGSPIIEVADFAGAVESRKFLESLL